MKITEEWLSKCAACSSGVLWFSGFGKSDSIGVMEGLLSESKLDWANWLIVRLLNRKDKIRYAIFAAEQVISIFEKKCPEDKRPRLAIEAAKAVIENDTKETRAAACAAYAAANTAALAAGDAAYAAANTAACAANTAAYVAYAAAAAMAAAWASWAAAAYAAAWAAGAAAGDEMKEKIVRYGLELHKKEKRKKGKWDAGGEAVKDSVRGK